MISTSHQKYPLRFYQIIDLSPLTNLSPLRTTDYDKLIPCYDNCTLLITLNIHHIRQEYNRLFAAIIR